MSVKRLNSDERVTYLLGLAVRRQIDQGPDDPDTVRELDAVVRWAEHWLSVEEDDITCATGILIDPDLIDEFELLISAEK